MTDKAKMLTDLYGSQSGPCCICGATNYLLSMGGPTICPSCDCGNFGITAVKRQRDEITHLRAQLATVVGALKWAAPLAYRAIEEHRSLRLKAGHNDISGTYKNGATWAGIYQSEVDAIERCRDALANLTAARKPLLSEVEGLRAQVTAEQNATTALNLEREIFRTGMLKERERAEKAESALAEAIEARDSNYAACADMEAERDEAKAALARLRSTQRTPGTVEVCSKYESSYTPEVYRRADACRAPLGGILNGGCDMPSCPLRAGQEG